MDIDSQNFDAKRYVLNMIKQNTIKQLIRKNNEVDQQIKVHDHQIQSLVFQNYSKFISSIDTVREMKDNICMVDEKLKILDSSMQKISELALKIDSTFSVKRKQIQKLDTINKDLQKLKNLCDFPNILKQDISYYRSLPQNKISSEVQNLFNKSITAYQSCYKTLNDLKQQPLIAPIYKQSLDKVENIRSILKGLQVQYKSSKIHCHLLRNITKKLLIITDDQVSILRIYFHPWKERLGEPCFKGEKQITSHLSQPQNGKRVMSQMNNSHIPQINQGLWKQFVEEFRFVYKQIYSKLTISSQQIQLHITHHMKQIFSYGLNNYIESAPLYCVSLKSYVHINHIITKMVHQALQYMKCSVSSINYQSSLSVQKKQSLAQIQLKSYTELKQKMEEKLQYLGITMFNYVFGRLKIYFILQVIDGKTNSSDILITQQSLKESQIKILNPLKDTLNTNYRVILDDLQHFKNTYELVFKKKQKFQQVIHKKIEELIHFLSTIVSLPSTFLSQQMNALINPNYNHKLNKVQKLVIQNVVKQLRETSQSGAWFFVVHSFLTVLNNHLGKKIIQSAQKNVQIPKNHDYGKVFSLTKISMSKNLIALANYYANRANQCTNFDQMLIPIQNFVEVLNTIFADSKRSIIKKPSFLTQQKTFTHETQILTAKKLHLIDRKNPQQRNEILTYFIRKLIKQLIITIRRRKDIIMTTFSEKDIYSIVQICYQMSNVEEQSQISAFFYLIKSNWKKQWKQTRASMEEFYVQKRKEIKA